MRRMGSSCLWRKGLVLIAATAGAMPAEASGAAAEPVPVYRCQLNLRLSENDPVYLRASKSFREDGTVNSMMVQWEDNQGRAVRRQDPNDRAFVTFQWPGGHRFAREGEPFDWSQGSIEISLITAAPGRHQVLRGEEWRQVVVDRDRAALVHDSDGMRILLLSGLDLHLMSELEDLTSPGRLDMGLDSLLAWGAGATTVTVYEMLVTRRPRTRNSSPTSPAGRRRIVGSYDIDVAALARAGAQARETTVRWEAGLASRWRECERTTEGGEILVTRAETARRPQAS
jgi:hypothetical protein